MTESLRKAFSKHLNRLLGGPHWGGGEEGEIIEVHEYHVLVHCIPHLLNCQLQVEGEECHLIVHIIRVLALIVEDDHGTTPLVLPRHKYLSSPRFYLHLCQIRL